jgi:hypothetical protein
MQKGAQLLEPFSMYTLYDPYAELVFENDDNVHDFETVVSNMLADTIKKETTLTINDVKAFFCSCEYDPDEEDVIVKIRLWLFWHPLTDHYATLAGETTLKNATVANVVRSKNYRVFITRDNEGYVYKEIDNE